MEKKKEKLLKFNFLTQLDKANYKNWKELQVTVKLAIEIKAAAVKFKLHCY